MTNYIWMAIGAYFTVGLLLWIKAVVKAVMLLWNDPVHDDANEQKCVEIYTEAMNENAEECGSMMKFVGVGILGNLIAIVEWPKYMQWYEEQLLSTVGEMVEKANRT